MYSTDTNNDFESRGYVMVSWPDEYDISVFVSGVTADGEWSQELENGFAIYLPEGNTMYSVYVIYDCDGSERLYKVSSFTPYMPNRFDVVVGGSSLVTYNRTISRLCDDSDGEWWVAVFNNGTNVEKFFTEKAITYKGSLFNGDTCKIDIVPKYGNKPYLTDLVGVGEKIVGSGAELTQIEFGDSEEGGYDIDYLNFLYPTKNAPDRVGYEVVGTRTKDNYYAAFYESDGLPGSTRIPFDENYRLTLPSIYKPFFFRCLIFRNCTDTSAQMQRVTYSMAVVNGTLYENKFSAITVCGDEIPETNLSQPASEWWNLTGGDFNDFKITHCEGTLSRYTSSNYTVYIKENEPEVGYQVLNPKDVSETIRFIGDSATPDTTVRYFMLCRSTENGTRQKINANESYISVLNNLQDMMRYDKDGHIHEGQDSEGIYWEGSVTNAFKVKIDDYGNGGYLIFSPKNELNRRNIFAGDISEIPSTHRDGDCFVLGIYDPWTKLDDDSFAAAQNRDSKYLYVGKDTDMLTVMKLYTVRDFIKAVQNENIYDDNNGSEDSNDESFVVTIDPCSDTLRISYGGSEHGDTVNTEQSVKLASFNIDNYNRIITHLFIR